MPPHQPLLAWIISQLRSSALRLQYHLLYSVGVFKVRSPVGVEGDGTVRPPLGSVGENVGIWGEGEGVWGMSVEMYGFSCDGSALLALSGALGGRGMWV